MTYLPSREALDDLNRRFSHHAPDENRASIHGQVRKRIQELAEFLISEIPPSREQALAITKLEEAMFWANAGLARNAGPS